MVQLTRIYTRGGDKGRTALGDGTRVPKDGGRVAAFGAVDETNAAIGLARLRTADLGGEHDVDGMLMRIQNDLFDLGADLSTPPSDDLEFTPLRMAEEQVNRLEQEMDALNAHLAPLKSFVLPGGHPAAAHLHSARTVARRAEQLIVALSREDDINREALRYANRLSDHLFVLGRYVNHIAGDGDVLWVPGAHR